MEGSSIRILLVDDDEDDHALVRSLLAEHSRPWPALKWAKDYDEALNAICSGEFDICLLDYRLGEKNGLEFLEEAKERGRKIPVIFFTGQGDQQVDIRAMQAGAMDYLQKDQLSAPLLERSIRYAIEHSRTREALQRSHDELEQKVRERTRELAEANKALKDSEVFLRSAMDALQGAIAVLDADGVILSVNESWQLFAQENGLAGSTFIGTNYLSICDGAEDPYSQEAAAAGAGIRDVIAGRMEQFSMEYSCHSPDERRWFSMNATRFKGDGPVRAVVAHENITERKKAEEALRDSEEHFRALVESAPDAIFVHVKGRFAYLNRAAADLLGADAQEQLLGLPVIDRIHPAFRKTIEERMRSILAEKTPLPRLEHQYVRLDGGVVDVEASGVPFKYGGEDGALVFVRDMSREKRAEEALELSKADYKALSRQFSAVLEAIPDSLSLISAGLEVLWANSSAIESMRGKDRYAPGKRCHDLWMLRDDPCETCHVLKAVKSGEPVTEIISEPSGQIWEYRLIPIKDDDGGVTHTVSLARDMTEQKRLEAQLRQAQKMEALGALAGGIAHDFNNILGIIVGYTEMALMDADEGTQAYRDLEEVLKAAGRARDLVRQILAFSRWTEQERKPVQVGLIVKEALKMLRASLPSTIEIRPNVSSREVVLADPTQIHQVLMNLCTNAAHAMRNKGGLLEVSLTDVVLDPEAAALHPGCAPGAYMKLTVMDTGHGIDPAIMERIFDPFFTSKEPGVGTGLGLSVVHGIVQNLGGAIEVESSPGEGTTFSILLPACPSGEPEEEREPARLPHGNERVLVVDDEEALALVAKQMLERLGYRADCLTSGTEALRIFREHPEGSPYDLVVTDMTMPHLTGADLADVSGGLKMYE